MGEPDFSAIAEAARKRKAQEGHSAEDSTEPKPVLDEHGEPVMGEDGKPVMEGQGTEGEKGKEDKGFAGDTHDIDGMMFNGDKVKALNPKFVQDWVRQGLTLTQVADRLEIMKREGKIPPGYRLPQQSEIVELKTGGKRADKFGKITESAGVGDRFSFLTDEGQGQGQGGGISRSSEWSVGGSSFDERNKNASSTEKRQLKIQPEDVIFLVKDEGEKLERAPGSMAA